MQRRTRAAKRSGRPSVKADSNTRKKPRKRQTDADADVDADVGADVDASSTEEEEKSSRVLLTPKGVKVLVEHERINVAKQVVVQIVEVLRFCPSSNINTITGLFDFDPRSAYDVVLSDGKLKMKCLLSPRLNSLVEQGHIVANAIVKLSSYSKRYDEADSDGSWVIVLNEVQRLGMGQPLGDIPYPRRLAERFAVGYQPSIGPRLSYVSLYNDDYFPVQSSKSSHLSLESEEVKDIMSHAAEQSIVTISQLAMTSSVDRVRPGDKSSSHHLLARVVAKSKIIHYAKPSSNAKSPTFYELILDDMTGTCKAILWTSLIAFYDSIRIGDIIYIRKFRVRVLPEGEFELVVNPAPRGRQSISVISSAGPIARIPRLSCVLMPLQHISQLPDNMKFDFCGVILYKSERQREYNTRKECYFEYRWILLTDFSCDLALPVKSYTNSQDTILESVQVRDHLLVTNLNGFSIGDVATSTSYRSLCASSSQLTSYVHEERASTIAGEEYMEVLVEGLEGKSLSDLQTQYRSTYEWIKDAAAFKAVFDLEMTPLRDVADIAAGLAMYEVKTLTVQGFLNWVVIHDEGAANDIIGTMSILDVNQESSLKVELSTNPCPQAHMEVPVVNNVDLEEIGHDHLLGLLRLLPSTKRIGHAAILLIDELNMTSDDYPKLAEFFQRIVGSTRQLFNLRLQRLSAERISVMPVSVLPLP